MEMAVRRVSRMEIAFVMADTGICGGNKYIFEVANRLETKKDHVYIVSEDKPDWIKVKAEFTDKMPDCDVTVATYWTTAKRVWKEGKGEKFYLVQNYEAWFPNQPIKEVEDTYRLPWNFIVDCEWLKNLLELRFNAKVLAVAPGGVNRFWFRPGRRVEVNRVLAVSRPNDGRRDMETTFKAIRKLQKKISDLTFVVYGLEKPDFPSEFHYAPSYRELPKIYRSCRVFVSSSLLEGVPLCHLEALACGCPVVTTPAGVEDYGVNGENMLIVPPKNPEALADAIMKVLIDDKVYDKLRKNGLETVKRFTWRNTSNTILNAFRTVLK